MGFERVVARGQVAFGLLKVGQAGQDQEGQAVGGFDPTLGPSGPVVGEDFEPTPGEPPNIGAQAKHYVEALDPLWAEFDDPDERTVARLQALLEEVGDEALRIHQIAQDMWETVPESQIPESVRSQFKGEFLAYARRVNGYKQRLNGLDPASTDTDEVYLGLVKRRSGAGPVPDAIMHLYFANQLGILGDHAHAMGAGFVGRVMTGLDAAAERVGEAAVAIDEAGRETKAAAGDFWEDVRELRWWIVGGAIVTVGVSVGIAVGVSRVGSKGAGA